MDFLRAMISLKFLTVCSVFVEKDLCFGLQAVLSVFLFLPKFYLGYKFELRL
jgi:hypothetical protein